MFHHRGHGEHGFCSTLNLRDLCVYCEIFYIAFVKLRTPFYKNNKQ